MARLQLPLTPLEAPVPTGETRVEVSFRSNRVLATRLATTQVPLATPLPPAPLIVTNEPSVRPAVLAVKMVMELASPMTLVIPSCGPGASKNWTKPLVTAGLPGRPLPGC